MTVRFFLHFGGKRAVKPRKGGSLPAGETWGGFLGLRSLGLPTAVSLHSPALRSLALRMGRHSHIWMDFPLVGLSRRHTHGLIIAEMVVYPLPAPLLPPCLPRGLEMLTVSLCFNHFSQKGKKKPQKVSGQAEEMSLLSLEMVVAVPKGLWGAFWKICRKPTEVSPPQRKHRTAQRSLGSLAVWCLENVFPSQWLLLFL